MKHSIALVTGATSGIGHAAAHLPAAEGYREVMLTAAGIEASEAPLNGHHQLTVGLLHSPSN